MFKCINVLCMKYEFKHLHFILMIFFKLHIYFNLKDESTVLYLFSAICHIPYLDTGTPYSSQYEHPANWT